MTIYLEQGTSDLHKVQGPDLPNILRQSHGYLTLLPKLRSTYDGTYNLSDILQRTQSSFLGTIYLQNHKIV